jgi:hypothetical protein
VPSADGAMTNAIYCGRCGLPLALLAGFALNGLAFVLYRGETTKGVAYSYVQPDDFTFSIWGLIYLMHLAFVGAQCLTFKVNGLPLARSYMALNYVLSGLWLVVNGAANKGFSYWLAVAVLFLNLFALVKIYLVLDIDYTDSRHSLVTRVCLCLPTSLNLSWVFLAAIVNLSNTLFDPDSTSPVTVGGPDFAIAVLGFATAVSIWLTVTRMDIGYAFVLVWACLGIHRNQQDETSDSPWKGSAELDTMAISCTVANLLAMVVGAALHICASKTADKDMSKGAFERLL